MPAKAPDIKTKTARAKLPPNRVYYDGSVGKGIAVGVRRAVNGLQTWFARCRHLGEQHYLPLGDLLSVAEPLRFEHAKDCAIEFARKTRTGGADAAEVVQCVTVWDACLRYNRKMRVDGNKKADGELRMLKHNVERHPIAKIPLDKLCAHHVSDWKEWLVTSRLPNHFEVDDEESDELRRRAKSTANRSGIVPLRAALNDAYANGLVSSDIAWKRHGKYGGRGDKKIDRPRKHVLTREQVEAIIAASSPEAGLFWRALYLSTMRIGEVARLDVADLRDRTSGILNIRESKTGPREVVLPADVLALFRKQCKGRVGRVPMFTQADGSAWRNSNDWRPAWRAAVDACIAAGKLTEDEDEPWTPYHLRHSALSDLVAHNVNLAGLSDLCGTSTEILSNVYVKGLSAITNGQIAAARQSASNKPIKRAV